MNGWELSNKDEGERMHFKRKWMVNVYAYIFPWLLIMRLGNCKKADHNALKTVKGGAVILSFDDHAIADWYRVDKKLQKYNWKATFFVSEPHLQSSEEIDKLRILQANGHEIGSHGVNHLNAENFTATYSVEDYINQEVLPSKQTLQNQGFAIHSFAYPYGARKINPYHLPLMSRVFNKANNLFYRDDLTVLDESLLTHFKFVRGTTYGQQKPNEQRNFASGNPLVFGLGIDQGYGINTSYIIDLLRYAKEHDKIVIFYGHEVKENAGGSKYTTNFNTLESICHYVKNNNIQFLTMKNLAMPKPDVFQTPNG